jgi:hypothetical protein
MTEHATKKQPNAVGGDDDAYITADSPLAYTVRHSDKGNEHNPEIPFRAVPSIPVKTQGKAQKVEAERQDP